MGFPLYVTCCFSLAAFNILSLCLAFFSLISMCLGVFSLGLPVWDSLCLLDLIDYFFSMLGKFSTIIFSKIFSYPFFFSSSSGTPINSNVGVFDIVPEVSETALSSFHSFYLILLFRSYFHHFCLPAH